MEVKIKIFATAVILISIVIPAITFNIEPTKTATSVCGSEKTIVNQTKVDYVKKRLHAYDELQQALIMLQTNHLDSTEYYIKEAIILLK